MTTLYVSDCDDNSVYEVSLTEYMSIQDPNGVPLAAHTACGDDFRGIFVSEIDTGFFSEPAIALTQWDPARGDLTVTDDAGRAWLVPPGACGDRIGDVCDRLLICDAAQAVALIQTISRATELVGWEVPKEDYTPGKFYGWNGGDCPVPLNARVTIWCLCGEKYSGRAADFYWDHRVHDEEFGRDGNIVAFRVEA